MKKMNDNHYVKDKRQPYMQKTAMQGLQNMVPAKPKC